MKEGYEEEERWSGRWGSIAACEWIMIVKRGGIHVVSKREKGCRRVRSPLVVSIEQHFTMKPWEPRRRQVYSGRDTHMNEVSKRKSGEGKKNELLCVVLFTLGCLR